MYHALVARGIKVQLVWSNGPANLPASTVDFRYPARATAPAWARAAWDALCDEIEDLRDRSLEQTFSYACADNQGLLDEVNRVLEAVRPRVVIAASTQLSGGAALMTSSRSSALSLLFATWNSSAVLYAPAGRLHADLGTVIKQCLVRSRGPFSKISSPRQPET